MKKKSLNLIALVASVGFLAGSSAHATYHLANGVACSENSQCISNNCAGVSPYMACAAAPVRNNGNKATAIKDTGTVFDQNAGSSSSQGKATRKNKN
jgi:hypothetical protein